MTQSFHVQLLLVIKWPELCIMHSSGHLIIMMMHAASAVFRVAGITFCTGLFQNIAHSVLRWQYLAIGTLL